MPTGEKSKLKSAKDKKGRFKPGPRTKERARVLKEAEELGVCINGRSTEVIAQRIEHVKNLSPLKLEKSVGNGGTWNWPKVIDIVTARLFEDPVRGLRWAVKEPWVDPETGKEWPLPVERSFYEAAQNNYEVRSMLAHMRRLQAQAIPEAIINKIEDLEEWVHDEKGARQNTAGVSKMKLLMDIGMRMAAHYDEEFVEKTKTEVEVRDQQLKDVIQQGLPALEDMKK